MIAGDRMNTRYFQVGGCADDMPPGFEQRLRAFLDEMPGRIDEYEGLLSQQPDLARPHQGRSACSRPTS